MPDQLETNASGVQPDKKEQPVTAITNGVATINIANVNLDKFWATALQEDRLTNFLDAKIADVITLATQPFITCMTDLEKQVAELKQRCAILQQMQKTDHVQGSRDHISHRCDHQLAMQRVGELNGRLRLLVQELKTRLHALEAEKKAPAETTAKGAKDGLDELEKKADTALLELQSHFGWLTEEQEWELEDDEGDHEVAETGEYQEVLEEEDDREEEEAIHDDNE